MTPEQVAEMLKTQKELQSLLVKLAEDNGKNADGTPKADAIHAEEVAKMTKSITDALAEKGLLAQPKQNFIWGKGSEGQVGQRVSFGQYLIMAKMNHPTLSEAYIKNLSEKTVMSEGTPAQGGYTVPQEYSNEIIGAIYDGATVLSKCTPLIHSLGYIKNIPKWLTGVSIAWVAEDGTKTITKPTLQPKVSTLKKIVVGPVPFTDEYLQDDQSNIVTGVNGLVKQAIEAELERIVLVGDVTGLTDPFNGIAYAVTGGNIVNQAGASLAYVDIIACWNNSSVLEQYRTGAEWYMNRVGMGLCLNILDLQNRPIFFIGMNDGNSNVGMTMLGSKVNLSSQILSTYGAGGDETNIIYGNYKYVLLGEKGGANGLQVAVSNSAVSGVGANNVGQNAFMQDETWYRFVLRRSVVVAVEEAFSVLKMVK